MISRPPITIEPDVGLSKPSISFISVVLPQPDAPTIATDSPSRMEKLQSLRIHSSVSEYRKDRLSTTIEASLEKDNVFPESDSSGGVKPMSAKRSP
ncbi:hypothetical protein D3C71_1758150 [compost metagenome]